MCTSTFVSCQCSLAIAAVHTGGTWRPGSIFELLACNLSDESEHYPDEGTGFREFFITMCLRGTTNIVFRAPLIDVCNTCEKLETQIFPEGWWCLRDLFHPVEQGGPGNGVVKMVIPTCSRFPSLHQAPSANNAYYKRKLQDSFGSISKNKEDVPHLQPLAVHLHHWQSSQEGFPVIALEEDFLLLAPEEVNDLRSLRSFRGHDDLRGAGEVQQREVQPVDDPDDTATCPWVLRECSHTPPNCNVDDLDY
ncbi:hypothetical protein Hamer_G031422, partial [Homarus americanus]